MSANTPKTLEQLKAEQRERYVRKQLQNGVSEEQWTSKLWTELSDKEKADLKNKVAQARQAQRNPEAKAEPASAQSEALGSEYPVHPVTQSLLAEFKKPQEQQNINGAINEGMKAVEGIRSLATYGAISDAIVKAYQEYLLEVTKDSEEMSLGQINAALYKVNAVRNQLHELNLSGRAAEGAKGKTWVQWLLFVEPDLSGTLKFEAMEEQKRRERQEKLKPEVPKNFIEQVRVLCDQAEGRLQVARKRFNASALPPTEAPERVVTQAKDPESKAGKELIPAYSKDELPFSWMVRYDKAMDAVKARKNINQDAVDIFRFLLVSPRAGAVLSSGAADISRALDSQGDFHQPPILAGVWKALDGLKIPVLKGYSAQNFEAFIKEANRYFDRAVSALEQRYLEGGMLKPVMQNAVETYGRQALELFSHTHQEHISNLNQHFIQALRHHLVQVFEPRFKVAQDAESAFLLYQLAGRYLENKQLGRKPALQDQREHLMALIDRGQENVQSNLNETVQEAKGSRRYSPGLQEFLDKISKLVVQYPELERKLLGLWSLYKSIEESKDPDKDSLKIALGEYVSKLSDKKGSGARQDFDQNIFRDQDLSMFHVLFRVLEREAKNEVELARLLSNTIPLLIKKENRQAHAQLNAIKQKLDEEIALFTEENKQEKLRSIYQTVLACHDVMAAKRYSDLDWNKLQAFAAKRSLSNFMLEPFQPRQEQKADRSVTSVTSGKALPAPADKAPSLEKPWYKRPSFYVPLIIGVVAVVALTALSVFFPPAAAIAAGVVKAMAGHALSGAALGGVVFGGGAVVTTVATVASASVDGIIRESRSSVPAQTSSHEASISEKRAALAKAKAQRDKAQQPELQSPVSNNVEVKGSEPVQGGSAQKGGVSGSKGDLYSIAIATNSELGGHQSVAPAQHMLADSSDQAQKNDSSGLNPS